MVFLDQFSPDLRPQWLLMRRRALRRYHNGDIVVYRYAGDGTPIKEKVLTGHTDIVLRVLFWPSRSNTMISCSKDGSVIVWDTHQGKATKTYKYVFVLSYHPYSYTLPTARSQYHSCFRDDGPVYGIWMSDQEGMPFILATGKSGLKCFISTLAAPH